MNLKETVKLTPLTLRYCHICTDDKSLIGLPAAEVTEPVSENNLKLNPQHSWFNNLVIMFMVPFESCECEILWSCLSFSDSVSFGGVEIYLWICNK